MATTMPIAITAASMNLMNLMVRSPPVFAFWACAPSAIAVLMLTQCKPKTFNGGKSDGRTARGRDAQVADSAGGRHRVHGDARAGLRVRSARRAACRPFCTHRCGGDEIGRAAWRERVCQKG